MQPIYNEQKYMKAIQDDMDNVVKIMKNYYLGDIEEEDDGFFLVKEEDFDPLEILNYILPQTNVYPFFAYSTTPLIINGDIAGFPDELLYFTTIIVCIKANGNDVIIEFPTLYPFVEEDEEEDEE